MCTLKSYRQILFHFIIHNRTLTTTPLSFIPTFHLKSLMSSGMSHPVLELRNLDPGLLVRIGILVRCGDDIDFSLNSLEGLAVHFFFCLFFGTFVFGFGVFESLLVIEFVLLVFDLEGGLVVLDEGFEEGGVFAFGERGTVAGKVVVDECHFCANMYRREECNESDWFVCKRKDGEGLIE
ncbi:MAG: hypothetical protein JOS17DRAFT_761177 [Linnemannia elongata]|nr:MAG: hypothetical protein JOS17DRAFT_761177 [Linnemannia elongata]